MSALSTLKDMASGWKSYAAAAAITIFGGGLATGVVGPDVPPVVVNGEVVTNPKPITFDNVEQAVLETAAQAAAKAAAQTQGTAWGSVLGIGSMLFGLWAAANRAAIAKLETNTKVRKPRTPRVAEPTPPPAAA